MSRNADHIIKHMLAFIPLSAPSVCLHYAMKTSSFSNTHIMKTKVCLGLHLPFLIDGVDETPYLPLSSLCVHVAQSLRRIFGN